MLQAFSAARSIATLVSAIFRQAVRPGDMLVVAGLQQIGRTKYERASVVDRIRAKKCEAFDAVTKLSTAKHLDKLMANAANARRGSSKKNRMPLDLVKVFWFDKLLRNKQVMERVNGDRRYKDLVVIYGASLAETRRP